MCITVLSFDNVICRFGFLFYVESLSWIFPRQKCFANWSLCRSPVVLHWSIDKKMIQSSYLYLSSECLGLYHRSPLLHPVMNISCSVRRGRCGANLIHAHTHRRTHTTKGTHWTIFKWPVLVLWWTHWPRLLACCLQTLSIPLSVSWLTVSHLSHICLCLSVCLFVYLSVCLCMVPLTAPLSPFFLSVYLSVCSSSLPPVPLSFYLSHSLPFSLRAGGGGPLHRRASLR